MKNLFSHSFTFQTDSTTTTSGRFENIIYLNDEDNIKHFVQYIQYHENDDSSINVRHMNIKMDRAYFLEIANVCINNRERRRLFFSTLGKRRFGASNKHFDSYLSHITLDEEYLLSKYIKNYEYTEFESCHIEKTQHSTNKYRIFSIQEKDLHIVFLDQLNITSRRKIHKIFCTDITNDELEFYNNITVPIQRVNYVFNKIGKNFFKKSDQTQLEKSTHYKTNEELACSMLITDANDMERTSRIQDNSTFRKLQEKRNEVGRVDMTLYKTANAFINNPTQETETDFSLDLAVFKAHIKDISGLKEITQYLEEVHELTLTHTISYLLSKNDQDLQDIFLYILESFNAWNNHLYADEENIRSFNAASVDLADALRYFVDICYKFKHDYKCVDAEEGIEQEIQTAVELEIALEPQIQKIEVAISEPEIAYTSAKSYFSEIDIDSEVYEELRELERDIDVLSYAADYTEDINSALIGFFEGYTRVLNPLFEFKDLSYSLMLLNQKLEEYEIDENAQMLLMLMRGLVSDLLEWKRTVLIEQTAEDIHFMDKSFYSNIAQIEISLNNKEEAVSDEAFGDDDFIEFF